MCSQEGHRVFPRRKSCLPKRRHRPVQVDIPAGHRKSTKNYCFTMNTLFFHQKQFSENAERCHINQSEVTCVPSSGGLRSVGKPSTTFTKLPGQPPTSTRLNKIYIAWGRRIDPCVWNFQLVEEAPKSSCLDVYDFFRN